MNHLASALVASLGLGALLYGCMLGFVPAWLLCVTGAGMVVIGTLGTTI